jgi:hypothetical protein
MYTIQDIKGKFPDAHSVGGELVARIDNKNVVLADLGHGSINLTKKGQELMGQPSEPKAAPVNRRTLKKSEPVHVEQSKVDPLDSVLDSILAE